MKLLVSACLIGVNCRYNAKKIDISADMQKLMEKHELIPFCPEVYGGLTTPRAPSEIRNGRVYSSEGADVTENFLRGAREALKLTRRMSCEAAVLKERSPSCGSGKIYDGTFSGIQVDGDGITAALLKKAGIPIFGETQLTRLL